MAQITQLIEKRKTERYFDEKSGEQNDSNTIHYIHHRWGNYCKALPPEVFLTLDSARTSLCERSFSQRNCRFVVDGFKDQLAKTNINHKPYFQLFHLSILELNRHVNDLLVDLSNYSFTCQRALKNIHGEYELLKVITNPYSITEDGRLRDFISWYIPLKNYEGEPFTSDVINLGSHNSPSFERYKLNFEASKKEMIHYLHFTKRQK